MSPVADNPPTLDEVCAYFVERESQGKPLLYITAEEFYATCETDGWTRGKDRKPIMNWKTYAITCNQWRQNHGDAPVSERRKPKQGEAVPASAPKEGKYKKW